MTPNAWKIAKILPLKKPNKGDYTLPGAYWPISLLPTLSKAMEYLIAQKIAYISYTYNLLPRNHFGGLKYKNTLDTLVVFQEKIYQAWKDKKVLSLITFDVQGAFNGVARDVLVQRLRKRPIPEIFISWINDFCLQRQAVISVNGETKDLISLEHAGLPQGSPLSPILFLFFNADLIQGPINKNKGSIAFIDDFTAWVTGDTIAQNVEKVQSSVIPHLLLENVQRIGSQAVTGGFSTVARCVAESEAGIEPVTVRHHNQQPAAWILWHIRPKEHRFWKVKTALNISNKRWISTLQKLA